MEKILSTVKITEFNDKYVNYRHLELDPNHLKLSNDKYEKYIISSLKGDLLSNKENNKLVNYSIIISDTTSNNKKLNISKEFAANVNEEIVPSVHVNSLMLFSKDLQIIKQKIFAYNKYTNDIVISEEVNSKNIDKEMEEKFKAEELSILSLFNMYKKLEIEHKNGINNKNIMDPGVKFFDL